MSLPGWIPPRWGFAIFIALDALAHLVDSGAL
jgi:hypothetical protein